ncbi:Detected protein of unknown function [Hibiscus syriacus]|uniref:Kinesin motor domain-containing protein n=1 Tax=Hibiscus syriacus TaxID=106335 RepID=A0A6A2Z2W7_HIBSY|nr:Detected protein of unknown function [Hibiscus syriacus]
MQPGGSSSLKCSRNLFLLNLEEENKPREATKLIFCRCSKSKTGENIKHSLENSNTHQSQGKVGGPNTNRSFVVKPSEFVMSQIECRRGCAAGSDRVFSSIAGTSKCMKQEQRKLLFQCHGINFRDLLSADSTPLRLLDDPERGTVVEKLTEETLWDRNHFKELLLVCEAQRQIGETSLNETSSRSHQILRVNFVDLAGSERASQTLSAGASKGNGHIPFRDSKLTRILQSSLGGNARTAVICTLSPARTYVEQSRNTLLFASCAKEVTTNAQVNVVVSDKALVKQLQRELSRLENELRNARTTTGSSDSAELLRKKDLEIERSAPSDRQSCSSEESFLQLPDFKLNIPLPEVPCKVRCIDSGRSSMNRYSESNLSESSPKNYEIITPLLQEKQGHFRIDDTGNEDRSKQESVSFHLKNSSNHPHTAFPSPEKPYLWELKEEMSNRRSLKLTRSISCQASLMTALASEWIERLDNNESTPPIENEKDFPGRPDILSRVLLQLSILLRMSLQRIRITLFLYFHGRTEETSKKQLADHEVQITEPILHGKDVKDVGLDPIPDNCGSPSAWPSEFRGSKEIIELWHACSVSLVHRTYFFLLFKGDSKDYIYMEVEHRRLSFLRSVSSHGNEVVETGQVLNPASRCARDSPLKNEKSLLKWGIGLNTKHRRLQLAYRLWTDPKDMDHIAESAAVVAKLVGFVDPEKTFKEMFGLNFASGQQSTKETIV